MFKHAVTFSLLAATALADERDVQIRSVDFANGIIELHNFGASDRALDGWRFCSHDDDEVRRYSAPAGLNGLSIEAGTSLFVHFNDDAPANDPDRVNRSTVGNFATPLDSNTYGMQIFFPDENGNVSFGNSSLIADYVQWKLEGEDPGNAGFRAGQAVGEGLWTATDDFVATAADSTSVLLVDDTNGRLHGPADYDVFPCVADIDGNGETNTLDFLAFLNLFTSSDDQADWNNDGSVNTLDFLAFLNDWNACR